MFYRITQGDVAGSDDEAQDYGSWEGSTPEAALLALSRSADATREYAVPVRLSTSAGHGRGAQTSDGSGNGAADRSAWYYVEDDAGAFVGIYTVDEQQRG